MNRNIYNSRYILPIIGVRIRSRRKELKLTQIQLSDILGIDKQYVSKIETGKVNLSIAYLHNVSKVLGICLSKFFEDL